MESVHRKELLRGSVGLKSALSDDDNVLLKLSYPEKRLDFFTHLYSNRKRIEQLVSRHLNVAEQTCLVEDVKEWKHGSFNVCIPVSIAGGRKALIRFALPYKVGESNNPGNVDEKVKCEAATFAWIKGHCRDVPIPRLWGFGLSTGETVSMYLR